MIVQPGGVYGPEDHSALGKQILRLRRGPPAARSVRGPRHEHGPRRGRRGRHPACPRQGPRPASRTCSVVRSRRCAGLLETTAKVTGRKPPRGKLPTGCMKAIAPLGPVVGQADGSAAELRELVSSSDGVTFWAKHDKAVAELGFAPRGLEAGLRETLDGRGQASGLAEAARWRRSLRPRSRRATARQAGPRQRPSWKPAASPRRTRRAPCRLPC